jgi:hypothetical protein
VEDGDHMVMVHRANQDGKWTNAECRLTATLARLLDADMYMPKHSEFYDVYATTKRPKSYSQWTSYVASFNAPNAKTWHYTAGDFWGGVISRFDRYGRWPTIEELFQVGQEHRFLPKALGQLDHWQRRIPNRAVLQSDPRYPWGLLIYQAYKGEITGVSKEAIQSTYPYNLKEEILEENAKILAQGLHPDRSATEKSNQEHAILEELESSHHDDTPDWRGTLKDARERLLPMLKSMKRDEIMVACREHCRMIAELWDLMSDKEKADYAEWHAVNIRDLGLEAKLIDILASPECLKIPLRCTGCPVCQEEVAPYNGSSPKIFQEHCKRKHKIDMQ